MKVDRKQNIEDKRQSGIGAGKQEIEQDNFLNQIYQYMRKKDTAPAQRMKFVQEWLQSYDTVTGNRPKTYYLQLLADVVLHDELKDRNSYKVTHREYPILSRWQQEYRYRKEYSIKLAEEYASDGKWYKRNIS